MTSFLALLAFALPLAVIDVRTRRLPNRLTGAAFVAVTGLVGLERHFGDAWRRGLLAAVASVLIYLLAHLLSRGGVGMGDVKFAAAIGMWSGSISWSCAAVAVEFAWMSAALVAMALLALRRTTLRSSLPFGPFMAIGVLGAAGLAL